MFVPDSTDWKIQMSTVGSTKLGSHKSVITATIPIMLTNISVEIKVAYLTTSNSAIQEDSSTYQFPSNLTFDKLLSRTTFEPVSEGNVLLPRKNLFGTRSRASTPSTVSVRSDVSLVCVSQSSQAEESHIELSGVQVQSTNSSSENQPKGAPSSASIRDRLLAMVRVETWYFLSTNNPRQVRSQSVNSRLTQTQEVSVHEIDAEMPTWMLVSAKDDELYNKREQFLAQPGFMSSNARIQCECGVSIKEGGMVSQQSPNNSY